MKFTPTAVCTSCTSPRRGGGTSTSSATRHSGPPVRCTRITIGIAAADAAGTPHASSPRRGVRGYRARPGAQVTMGLINWIFDFYQHSRISDARDEAAELRREVASLRTSRGDVDQDALLQAVGQLALAVKTVQRLCVEKGVCTEAEFHRRLREIDA